MHEHYGVKTVVVGGKPGVKQDYAGTVGGESSSNQVIGDELFTWGLDNDPLAPPEVMSQAIFGITWRLGYSIRHPDQPEGI